MATTKEKDITPLRSLNVAAIGGKPKLCVNSGKPIFVGRIYGEVTDVKHKEDRNGKLQAQFVGEFVGVGPDGSVFSSGRLYLPGTISEGLEGQLKTSDGKPVRFAYDLVAVEAEKSPVGYVYSMKTLIKTEASDRIAEMTAEMNAITLPAATKEKAARA